MADSAPNKTLSTKRSICTSTTVPAPPAKDWLATLSSITRSVCISRLATAPPPKFTSTRPYRKRKASHLKKGQSTVLTKGSTIKAGIDDFGLTPLDAPVDLVVSGRALDLLQTFQLQECEIIESA